MSVQERVLRTIVQEGHRPVAPDQMDLSLEQLGLDSLDKICILFGLEKEFNLSIPEEEARQYSTVRQIIEAIHRHLGASSQSSVSG